MNPKEWWTVAELAKAASVSGARVRQELAIGWLRGDKAGQTWVIPDAEAQRWLTSRRRWGLAELQAYTGARRQGR